MNNDDLVSWLVDEIDEALDVSAVGLYEFVWTLRGKCPSDAATRLKHISQQALDRIRTNENVELVRMRWSQTEPLGAADWHEVQDRSWDDVPESGEYLAVARS